VARTYDCTPPAAVLKLPPRLDGTSWPRTGGADAFLDFITQDLKPTIEREFPIDAGRQALFGHSFGGLFTLHALFTRPHLFDSYIAASPSIWWNECFVLDEERAFSAVRDRPRNLDVLITVGGCEQELVPAEASGVDRAWRAEWKRQNRMVDNARELAARLARLAEQDVRVAFQEFAGEDHVSVIPAAISRAVGFALALRR
jgi:uncharacterized protein